MTGSNGGPSKRILVVDVPAQATAETAERLLNEACEQGYYILAIHTQEGGGARAFFNLRTRLDRAGAPRALGNRDGKEDAALEIIRMHPGDTIAGILGRLRAAGIQRGRNWVSQKRRGLFATAV